METPANKIEILFERAEAYGKTTFELSKLKTLDTSINVAISLVSQLTIIIMISLFAFVLTIGIALWLGEFLGKSYYGFFIVAAFYLVAGIVFRFYLNQWIKKPISNIIISQVIQ